MKTLNLKKLIKRKKSSVDLFKMIVGVVFVLHFSSCGQSGNSKIFTRAANVQAPAADTGVDNNAKCIKGCYQIPQSWYDAGIVVDNNKNIIGLDGKVNAFGSCNFKVCPDPNDPFRKSAEEYVNAFTGKIFDDSSKCTNGVSLVTSTFNSSVDGQDSGLGVEVNPVKNKQQYHIAKALDEAEITYDLSSSSSNCTQ